MDIKILQINLNRCRAAHDLLHQSQLQLQADVVLISEPYTNNTYWFTDTGNCSAIWVTPRALNRGASIRHIHSGFGHVSVLLDDTLIISCYFAPSLTLEQFCQALDEIEEVIKKETPKEIIIGGDFNAKSPMWGSRFCDRRGSEVMAWAGKNNILPARSEGKATFNKNGKKSLIDFILCDNSAFNRLTSSKILKNFTASDHFYLLHHFDTVGKSNSDPLLQTQQTETQLKLNLFTKEYRIWTNNFDFSQPASNDVINKYITGLEDLVNACRVPKSSASKDRKNVWWWNEEIAALRIKTINCRRRLQRSLKKGDQQLIDKARLEYKDIKRTLNKAIKTAKYEGWKAFIDQIDSDIWGRPYRAVIKNIKGHPPPVVLDMNQVDEIIKGLFVTAQNHPQTRNPADPWRNFIIDKDNDINKSEVTDAIARIKKKSTGPDGIPMEVLKWLCTNYVEHVTWLLNGCYKNGVFPSPWKCGRLVLLPKNNSGCTKPSDWRPLCILSNWAKLYEHILKKKLMKRITHAGNQYGFCKKKSTVDAMNQVMSVWAKARRAGKYCLLITLDVRNAFNSLRWSSVLRSANDRCLTNTLKLALTSYLDDRNICYKFKNDDRKWSVFAGVPQGSVLGPTLWNLVYDELLLTKLSRNVDIVGYADDVALVFVNDSLQKMREDIDTSMAKICKWFQKEGLSLASEKTEMVLLTGKKKHDKALTIPILNKDLGLSSAVKYLGVLFGGNATFKEHVNRVTERALKATGALARIMPNHGGGGVLSRTLYYRTVEAIALYGAPIWHNAINISQNVGKLRMIQRAILCRVVRAYRSTSTDALCVLAGLPPWDLLIDERARIYKRICLQDMQTKRDIKREERRTTMTLWQSQWDTCNSGRQTYKFIKNIKEWVDWGPKILNHHLTQILTGHGCFGAHKHRMGKIDTPKCWFCDCPSDDADHTLFDCKKWVTERRELERQVGILKLDTFVNLLQVVQKRELLNNFVTSIMKKKFEYEKIMDRAGNIAPPAPTA